MNTKIENQMRIKSDSDDDRPLGKILSLHEMTIVTDNSNR